MPGILHLRPHIRVDRGEPGSGPSPLTGPDQAPLHAISAVYAALPGGLGVLRHDNLALSLPKRLQTSLAVIVRAAKPMQEWPGSRPRAPAT